MAFQRFRHGDGLLFFLVRVLDLHVFSGNAYPASDTVCVNAVFEKWRFYHTPEGNGGARRIGGRGQLPPAWETSKIALPHHWGRWSAHPRREETSKIALSRLCLSRGFTMLLPGPVLPSEVWKNRPNTSDTTYRIPQNSLRPKQEGLSGKPSMTKRRIAVFTRSRFLFFTADRVAAQASQLGPGFIAFGALHTLPRRDDEC